MLFTSKVSAAYGKLTHSQKVVANYVDENYEDIAFSTLEELAEKIGVSTTTVIRFARALDYSGFSEMQDSIKKEIQTKGSLPDRLERAVVSSGNDLLEEAFSTDIKNIQLTLAGLHADDLEKAIEMISGAKKIYVLGMRSSFSPPSTPRSPRNSVRTPSLVMRSTQEELLEALRVKAGSLV